MSKPKRNRRFAVTHRRAQARAVGEGARAMSDKDLYPGWSRDRLAITLEATQAALRDAIASNTAWADIAIGMLDELRLDYAPLALGDGDGRAAIAKLRAQLAAARALLEDVWQQFAVPGKDGKLWAGGLSTLEAVEAWLSGGEGKAK